MLQSHIAPFLGATRKGHKMQQGQDLELENLPGVFAEAYIAAFANPTSCIGQYAYALASGEDIDTSLADAEAPAIRGLCVALFNYCMAEGLTEDERQLIESAFLIFSKSHGSAGTIN